MIQLRELHFSYKDEGGSPIPAIRDMNLSIPEGSYVAVIGPNGSGKSTLAYLLAGILFAASGELKISGLDPKIPKQREKLRSLVGLIFQNPDNQLVSVTVEKEVAFGLENLGLPPQEIKKRVDWALEKFNLERYRFGSPNKLSGGEKQRLAIASILVTKPAYLILDEPTSFLDPTGRDGILSILDKLNSDPGELGSNSSRRLTVIHITQFPEEACLARKVVVLNQGRVALEGDPEEVFSQVELLEGMGLCLPRLGKLRQLLRQEGLCIDADFCQPERFCHSLISARKDPALPRPPSQEAVAFPRLEALSNSFLPNSREKPDQIVSLKEVSFRYSDFTSPQREVLSEVQLSIAAGEFVGLVGPTGSGKTTLANIISGLLKPTSGEVRFQAKEKIGLVFQFPEGQFFREKVSEDIAYGLKNLGYRGEEVGAEVERSLQLVNLKEKGFSHRQIHTLSGGEKRRVAIASILAMRPKLLILDEPFIALDSEATVKIKESLRKIQRDGASILLISHDLVSVFELINRLIILKEGRIIADLSWSERQRWVEAASQSGLVLPDHLALVRRLKDHGWEVDYADISVKGTASQIVKNFFETKRP